MQGLLKNTKIVRHSAGVVAGTSTVTPSAGINMAGFNSCLFLVAIGAVTSTGVPSVKVQQSSDDGSTDGYSDLEGTSFSVSDTDDDGVIAVEIIKPAKQYLKCIVTRATANCVLDGILAILGNPIGPLPITQTTLGNEVHVTPAEGTA